MKQKYLALKLYLLGLTAGVFVFGWSVIARADSTQSAETAAATANQPVVQAVPPQQTTGRTFQTQRPNLQPIPAMPRFRTRTS